MDARDFERVAELLARWAADDAVGDARRRRSRREELRRRAAEAATLTGVLIDLCERQTPVVLGTRGRPCAGRIEAVTTGLCALRDDDGALVLVQLTAVTSLSADLALTSGERIPDVELDLVGALGALAAERPEVRLDLAGGAVVTGRLDAVGTQVATLRFGGLGPGRTRLVVLDAVTACRL